MSKVTPFCWLLEFYIFVWIQFFTCIGLGAPMRWDGTQASLSGERDQEGFHSHDGDHWATRRSAAQARHLCLHILVPVMPTGYRTGNYHIFPIIYGVKNSLFSYFVFFSGLGGGGLNPQQWDFLFIKTFMKTLISSRSLQPSRENSF
jgi:hypothetical protein